MTKRKSVWFGAILVAGSFGLLLSAGAADAAAFRVGFDPTFSGSGTFANLGFKGSGDLTIDDGCFPATSGEVIVPSGTCLNAFFTSLTLDLYNATDGPGTVLETLTYAPPDQNVGGVVTDVISTPPGELVGIDTVFFGPLTATAITGGTAPPPLPTTSRISLEFVSGFKPVPFSFDPNVILQICDTNNQNCSDSTGKATVTFTLVSPETVPEPGSAMLILTALGALGWMRRRRSRG